MNDLISKGTPAPPREEATERYCVANTALSDARQEVQQREGISEKKLEFIRRKRRNQRIHHEIRCFTGKLTIALAVTLLSGAIAYLGSINEARSVLYFGYGMCGLGCFHLCMLVDQLSRRLDNERVDDVLPGETIIDESGLLELKKYCKADQEIVNLTKLWWSKDPPIRTADLDLVRKFAKAKLMKL